MGISAKSISVVVQGPIDWSTDVLSLEGTTLTLLKNLRLLLPEAEIVLSTWEGQRIDSLDYDDLIISALPAAQGDWPGFVANNVNRQILSTCAGLEASSREYVLKLRTDIVLENLKFLEVFESACLDVDLSTTPKALFRSPIVTNNLSSRSTQSILDRIGDHPLPMHPSDHVQFGRKKDLLALWTVPLQTDEDAFFFLDFSHPNRWRLGELSRLAPEQHIFSSALAKVVSFRLENYADSRPEILALSEHYLNSHFIVIPDRLFSIRFAKYHTDHHFSFEWMRMNHLPHNELINRAPSKRPRAFYDNAYRFVRDKFRSH